MKIKRLLVNVFFYTLMFLNFASIVQASGGAGGTEIELPTEAKNTITEITQILFLIGAGVCIGKCIHIGILYVTSSAAEKSNAKMAILPWLIGTFVCFGAATLGTFIINLLKPEGNKSVLDY